MSPKKPPTIAEVLSIIAPVVRGRFRSAAQISVAAVWLNADPRDDFAIRLAKQKKLVGGSK